MVGKILKFLQVDPVAPMLSEASVRLEQGPGRQFSSQPEANEI